YDFEVTAGGKASERPAPLPTSRLRDSVRLLNQRPSGTTNPMSPRRPCQAPKGPCGSGPEPQAAGAEPGDRDRELEIRRSDELAAVAYGPRGRSALLDH